MDYYSGIRHTKDTWMSRDEAFAELRRRGAMQANVHFSGGHDSGGTERIELFRIEVPEFHEFGRGYKQWQSHLATHRIGRVREHIWPEEEKTPEGEPIMEEVETYNGKKYMRPKKKELTEEEELEMRLGQTLAAPIYDEFQTFAGEFSVEGVVRWYVRNLIDGVIEMERTVSVESSETDSYTVYDVEEERLANMAAALEQEARRRERFEERYKEQR